MLDSLSAVVAPEARQPKIKAWHRRGKTNTHNIQDSSSWQLNFGVNEM